MASCAVIHLPSSSFTIAFKTHLPFRAQNLHVYKPHRIKASTSFDYSTTFISDKPPTSSKNSNWQWKYKENSVNIYYEAHEKEKDGSSQNILMIPTISDVSTVEEWRSVAKDIVGRDGATNYRATIVDWPGLGYSDRPKLDYDAAVMEKFLVDFINAPDGPLSESGELKWLTFGV